MGSEMKYLLEKATSPLLLETDWDTTLQIVDKIRQGDIQPKVAVAALLAQLEDKNPNIVISTLAVMESVIKNCGSTIHDIIATKDSMGVFYNLLHRTDNEEVKTKVLTLLSAWQYAFRHTPKYSAVRDCLNLMKMEGFQVPSVVETDAMFIADKAPDWADGEKCYRCRTAFSMLRRKHHCRACGQVFCSECSNKNSTIPKFGIEREVRVCHDCYLNINSPTRSRQYNTATRTRQPAKEDKPKDDEEEKKKAQQLQEEEELQLALALSKSEAETKEKEKMKATSTLMGPNLTRQPQRTTSPPFSSKKFEEDEPNPELEKYLNRSYWEAQKNKKSEQTEKISDIPSAPQGTKTKFALKTNEVYLTNDPDELDDFVASLRSQLEIFVNRMKSNQSRGRPIANDSAVQSLFMSITTMHAQLLKHIQGIDHKRVYYEELQDKISQTRDARAALEALREEHRDKLRREREEQERIRQMQMMQKLEIMRKKKQEYLEYQRQMALHRMAESERQILNQPQTAPPGHGHPGHGHPGHYPMYPGYPGQPGGYGHDMTNYQQNGYPPVSMNTMAPAVPPLSGQLPAAPTQPNQEYGYVMAPGMAPPTPFPNVPPMSQADPIPQPNQPPKQEEAALISFD